MAGRLAEAGTPAATVFVGNLSYDLTDKDVVDFFSSVGPVKTVRMVNERETGKPRGFGFVEFYDIPTAESAIRNLSGTDFRGRVIRIVFAEGGPPSEFRPREDHRFERDRNDDRWGRSQRDRVVGGDLSYHSSLGVATLAGAPMPPGTPASQATMILARKTRSELYEYIHQMQGLLQQNPKQARQLLADNPALTKALFQAEVILSMVGNPLGDVAPKGVAPPGTMPGRHFDPVPPQQHAPDQHMAPPMQQQQQPMMQPPPPQQYMPPPQGQPNGMQGGYQQPPMQPPPQYMQPPLQQPQYMPELQQQQQPYMAPPEAMQPPPHMMPVPMQPAVGMQPMHGMQGGPADPRLAGAPVDPRRGPAAGGPRPMMSMASVPGAPMQSAQPVMAAPMAAQPAAVAPAAPVIAPEQQALLQQVLRLTPQQIELLPEQQKAQVLALQQQLRAQGMA